jgi:ketopantoate reductase
MAAPPAPQRQQQPPPGGGKRVGILGAGAIGSVVGGMLAHDGHDVTLIDAWTEHIEAIQQSGLTVRAPVAVCEDGEEKTSEALTYPGALHFKDMQAINEPFDMGIIAVNAYDTDWAAACLDRFVRPTSEGVCCFSLNSLQPVTSPTWPRPVDIPSLPCLT